MYFDGNDFIYNGMLTVTQGTFQGASSPNVIAIQVQPSSGGTPWYLSFDSTHLGVPLDAGVYENAQRESFSMPGHPGLEVYGNGHGCNTITGRFQVHEHVRDANGLVSATVSFEQHCEGGAPVLNGCIHYER